jgi:hypothetical protein
VVTDGQLRLGPGSRVVIRPAAGADTTSTRQHGPEEGRAAGSKAGKGAG